MWKHKKELLVIKALVFGFKGFSSDATRQSPIWRWARLQRSSWDVYIFAVSNIQNKHFALEHGRGSGSTGAMRRINQINHRLKLERSRRASKYLPEEGWQRRERRVNNKNFLRKAFYISIDEEKHNRNTFLGNANRFFACRRRLQSGASHSPPFSLLERRTEIINCFTRSRARMKKK